MGGGALRRKPLAGHVPRKPAAGFRRNIVTEVSALLLAQNLHALDEQQAHSPSRHAS